MCKYMYLVASFESREEQVETSMFVSLSKSQCTMGNCTVSSGWDLKSVSNSTTNCEVSAVFLNWSRVFSAYKMRALNKMICKSPLSFNHFCLYLSFILCGGKQWESGSPGKWDTDLWGDQRSFLAVPIPEVQWFSPGHGLSLCVNQTAKNALETFANGLGKYWGSGCWACSVKAANRTRVNW